VVDKFFLFIYTAEYDQFPKIEGLKSLFSFFKKIIKPRLLPLRCTSEDKRGKGGEKMKKVFERIVGKALLRFLALGR